MNPQCHGDDSDNVINKMSDETAPAMKNEHKTTKRELARHIR